jgi:calpain family cysteine protease
MNLWTQITGGKDSKTTQRRPRKARPGLETMESRTMLSAVATFKLIDGDLYEKQGRHQSLVATNVVSLENLNRRSIQFVEQNGNVFEKTAKGPAELIQRGNPTPMPNPNPTPNPNPSPTPNPSPVNDWFSQNLANAGIANLARAEFARDGSITFGDMESIFDEVLQSGAVTTSDVQDLATLVNNAAGLRMPAYVANLAGKVINPSSADVAYVDWCYSNQAPMPLMEKLVDQWFEGTALPIGVDSCDGSPAEDPDNYYTAAGATGYTLFGSNGPSYTDVSQGSAGDCWFLASLAETAARDASAITNMFINNGNGSWTVRFFANGTPDYVTVNDQLPVATANPAYNGGYAFDQPLNGILWVALAEKALAQENLSGQIKTAEPGVASYAALNGNFPNVALAAITGLSSSEYDVTPGATAQIIAAAMQAGDLVCIGTNSSAVDSHLVSGHCYAVIGYDPSSSMPFELFNPWGTATYSNSGGQIYGTFYSNGAFLEANFDSWGLAGSAEPGSASGHATVAAGALSSVNIQGVDPFAATNSNPGASKGMDDDSLPVILSTATTAGRGLHSSSGQRAASLPGGPLLRTSLILGRVPIWRQAASPAGLSRNAMEREAMEQLKGSFAQEQ